MATLQELANQLNEYMSQNETSVRASFAAVAEEINALQTRQGSLETSSQEAFASARQRIEGIEERGHRQGENGGKGRKNLIHPKMMTPSVLSKPEQWKRWVGDVAEYCENIYSGMKDIMQQACKADNDIEEAWFNDTDDCWWERADELWSLLRRYTEGEARRVVMGVANNNGWNAWRRLQQNFEPSIVIHEAHAYAQFSGMVSRRAKNPSETRTMLLELEERSRRIEEMTGQAPEDRHTMSIVMGIIDLETLKHTAHFQGLKKSVVELKRKAMEFVNLTTPSNHSKSDAMDIGRVEARREVKSSGTEYWEIDDDEEWNEEMPEDDDDGNLNGFGEKCFHCQGFGHYARECPQKGKGKGYPKGKGKGPVEGCFTCGGEHYANVCPNGTQRWTSTTPL
jgi:hypothetical protein